MKRLLTVGIVAICSAGAPAWAACDSTNNKAAGSAFGLGATNATRLGTMTADNAQITGGCVSGVELGGTFSGTYALGGTPTINGSGTYDLSTTGAATRYNLWNATLSPSVNTTNIWENLSSFVNLNGPGQANGEINQFHANFTVASGALSAQAEGFESKLQNSGTVTEWDSSLLIPQNNAGGTATRLYGAKCQLTQANASAGAVNTYACIDNEAMAGGGSQPTGNLFLRNADANAYSGILGHINIGTLTDQTFPLYVQGTDAAGSTFSVVFKNGTPANIFSLANNGDTNLGLNSSSTVTSNGSFNVASGAVYKANGTVGVTCAGSPTVSFASTVGIVTHC